MDIIDKITIKIKNRMKERNVSQAQLASYLGYSSQYVSDMFRRVRGGLGSIETLEKISSYLEVPVNYFFDGVLTNDIVEATDGVQDYTYIKFYDVRVSAGSGLPSEAEEFRMLPVEKNFIKVLGYDIKDLNAVIVEGDSMEPTLRNGDRVIICIPSYPMDFVPGVYVIRDVAGLKVKRLDNDKDGSLEVMSDNNYYKTRIYSKEEVEAGSITIIGRVVGRFGAM